MAWKEPTGSWCGGGIVIPNPTPGRYPRFDNDEWEEADADQLFGDVKTAGGAVDGPPGLPSFRTLGTSPNSAAAGDDTRLSDARIPKGSAGGDLTGTFPNASVAQVGGLTASVLVGKANGALQSTLLGAANGVAELDSAGQVKSSQLNLGVPNGLATLDSDGHIPFGQIPTVVAGGLHYSGVWNATTNSPNLTSSAPPVGSYYVVSVAGSTALSGITDWKVGDWAIYAATGWQKIDNTDAVSSVNGKTGTVVLTVGDIATAESTANKGVAGGYPSLNGSGLVTQNPANTNLLALAGVTAAADKLPYFTGSTAAGVTTITSFGRSLLAASDAEAGVETLEALSAVQDNLVIQASGTGFVGTGVVAVGFGTLLADTKSSSSGRYVTCQVASGGAVSSGVRSGSYAACRREWLTDIRFWIRTPTTLSTTTTFWCGLFESDPSTYFGGTGIAHSAIRSDYTAGSHTWLPSQSNGGTPSVGSSLGALSPNTEYLLRIRFVGSTVRYSLNGGTEVSYASVLTGTTGLGIVACLNWASGSTSAWFIKRAMARQN